MKNSLCATGALLLSLSLCGGLLTVAQAAPAKGTAKPAAKSAKPAANGKKPQMQRMFEAINASPALQKTIRAGAKTLRDQVKAIQTNPKLSDTDKKTKVKAARQTMDNKMKALMSADQKTKLTAFRKQMAAENKAKAKKGKN